MLVFATRRPRGGRDGGARRTSAARRRGGWTPRSIRITFDDVAGIDEAKAELTEIVDFLREPDKYGRLGGRMPHGVLLYGPPGTGKTLLARAVAGEAHAAFFSISASEFIEAIVGVGASRVRDLFVKAKEAEPAIIFIDELDAIGRSRAGQVSVTGANDEREQTLDQILTELDGFEPAEAVVVLAATNRIEILDLALLRPGRFDRRVAVQPPDRVRPPQDPRGPHPLDPARRRRRPRGARRDDGGHGRRRPGEPRQRGGAARGAPRPRTRCTWPTSPTRSRRSCSARRVASCSCPPIARAPPTTRAATRSSACSPRARTRCARCRSSRADMALGVTLSSPDSDRVSYTREELEAKIHVALGGRVAEEVVYGTITTGAESDIQQLTQIVRHMVGRWGMSERIGPVAVLPADGEGSFFPGVSETSPETAKVVDAEVTRIVAEARTRR